MSNNSTDAHPLYLSYQHPHHLFAIDYPEHWKVNYEAEDHSVEFVRDGTDLGVGLMIFRMPMAVDANMILESGQWQNVAEAMFQRVESTNIRRDPTIIYANYTADRPEQQQAGQRWFVLEADLILCISSTIHIDQRELYGPIIDRMLSSLRIDRDEDLLATKIMHRFAAAFRTRLPDCPFQVIGRRIRTNNIEVSIENLVAQIFRNPTSFEEATDEFIEATLSVTQQQSTIGKESWEDVRDRILPLIKPDKYVQHANSQTNKRSDTDESYVPPFLASVPWLANLRLCFAIDDAKSFRFVNSHDMQRWDKSLEELGEVAAENLAALPPPEIATAQVGPDFPKIGSVQSESGPISSYILHPKLFEIANRELGRDLLAALPSRDSLMLFDGAHHRETIMHALKMDFDSSNHPISDRLFRVTPDGIALA